MLAGLDPIRNQAIALAIHRIKHDNIPGDMAEVGVYRGELSRVLHQLAPSRPLYLFDTFEGFPEIHITNPDPRYNNTSPEIVLQSIGDSENIFIKKGLVPHTFKGLENKQFAFVMLDLDLQEPTMASLEFFYPRVNDGGYIFIHDYHNREWPGVARAVDKFLKITPECQIVEIPDAMGSVIIRKSLDNRNSASC